MTAQQEAVLIRLVSLLKAHGMGDYTIDQVIEIWSASCAGIRFTIPTPKGPHPRKRRKPWSKKK